MLFQASGIDILAAGKLLYKILDNDTMILDTKSPYRVTSVLTMRPHGPCST